MAFSPQEEEIIRYGKANGKSRAEVEAALSRLRSGVGPKPAPQAPATEEPSMIRQAADAGVAKASEGFQAATTATNPVEVGEGLLKVGAGAIETASAPLAPLFSPLGKVIGYVADKASDIPAVQKFADSKAGEITERIAGDVADASTIAGTVVGLKGAPTAAGAVSGAMSRATNAVTSDVSRMAKVTAPLPSASKAWIQKPIEANVQNVLKETPTQLFDQYVSVANKAVQSNKNITPLEVAGRKAQDALEIIQDKLKAVGEQKRDFMGVAGEGLTPVDKKILTTFNQKLQSFRNSRDVVAGDTRLVSVISNKIKELENQSVVTANDIDRFVDFAQDQLYTSGRDLTVPVTDATTARLRSLVGELNQGLKGQLPERYTALNDEASRLYGIRDELNTKLGKEGEKGGALMKRVFSPSDANTKKLFADVLDLTGIDLVNEATLARFIMDVLGDTRQKNMLKQLNLVNTTPSGLVDRIIDYVVDKANSPEETIKRARALTAPVSQ